MFQVQLIYVSTVSEKLSDEILDKILESSVRHNTLQDITGMLLYSEGHFLQVLEGKESEVNETYERICNDPRHHNICLLSLEPIAQREFPKWSMGFHRITASDAESHPAFAALFANGLDPDKITSEPSLAKKLIKQFSQF